jgi:hypothetical protein
VISKLRWAPAQVQGTAREGLAQGLQVASHFPAPVAPAMRDEVTAAFMSGLHPAAWPPPSCAWLVRSRCWPHCPHTH